MNGHTKSSELRLSALMRWAWRVSLRRWPYLAGVCSVLVLRVGMELLRPWPMKVIIDHALRNQQMSPRMSRLFDWLPGSNSPQNLILWCVLATILFFVLGRLLTMLGAIMSVSFGQRLTFDVAGDLFRHLQRLSMGYHHRRALGDTMRRVTVDSSCASTLIKDALLPVFTSLLTLCVMFLVLWQLNAFLAMLAFVVVPFLFIVIRVYAQPMVALSYEQQEVEGRMYTIVERTLSAIPVIQAFVRENDVERQFRESTDASLSAGLATTRVQLRFKFFVGLCTTAGTAVIMWIGARQVIAGELSAGGVIVFLAYLAAIYAPLETMVYSSSTIQSATGSARRVVEVLESDPDVVDRPGAMAMPTARGEVVFEQVTFAYEAGRPVLHDINLNVSPGQTTAIVGSTGAGKSTLVSLIPRFFDPVSGCVTVDGQNLRDVRLRDLRRQIGMVLQEPFLFPISVGANIAYGKPDATREEIERAAKSANAHEFICRLPDGYDTVVGERGATLSGGERQRISIARALLKNAPILILDEPTSAVDAETERLIQGALQQLWNDKTTFIIAHRLSTVRRADCILVLDHGRIVETGRHDELLERGGTYFRLHRLQFGEADPENRGES
jgi:ATP-binding cassette subfamily B protein/subfamily B ATP-binding cassette protein MsbA